MRHLPLALHPLMSSQSDISSIAKNSGLQHASHARNLHLCLFMHGSWPILAKMSSCTMQPSFRISAEALHVLSAPCRGHAVTPDHPKYGCITEVSYPESGCITDVPLLETVALQRRSVGCESLPVCLYRCASWPTT